MAGAPDDNPAAKRYRWKPPLWWQGKLAPHLFELAAEPGVLRGGGPGPRLAKQGPGPSRLAARRQGVREDGHLPMDAMCRAPSPHSSAPRVSFCSRPFSLFFASLALVAACRAPWGSSLATRARACVGFAPSVGNHVVSPAFRSRLDRGMSSVGKHPLPTTPPPAHTWQSGGSPRCIEAMPQLLPGLGSDRPRTKHPQCPATSPARAPCSSQLQAACSRCGDLAGRGEFPPLRRRRPRRKHHCSSTPGRPLPAEIPNEPGSGCRAGFCQSAGTRAVQVHGPPAEFCQIRGNSAVDIAPMWTNPGRTWARWGADTGRVAAIAGRMCPIEGQIRPKAANSARHRPGWAEIRRCWTEVDQFRPSSAWDRLDVVDLGQNRPELLGIDKVGPSMTNIVLGMAKVGPNPARLGPTPTKLGPTVARVGPTCPEFSRMWAEFGLIWHELGRTRRTSARERANSTRPEFGQIWATRGDGAIAILEH